MHDKLATAHDDNMNVRQCSHQRCVAYTGSYMLTAPGGSLTELFPVPAAPELELEVQQGRQSVGYEQTCTVVI